MTAPTNCVTESVAGRFAATEPAALAGSLVAPNAMNPAHNKSAAMRVLQRE
jgi:hypothetical protein